MTRKEKCIELISKSKLPISCANICFEIILSEQLCGNTAKYLSGSISSILAKLVKEGRIGISIHKGPRGGMRYISCP